MLNALTAVTAPNGAHPSTSHNAADGDTSGSGFAGLLQQATTQQTAPPSTSTGSAAPARPQGTRHAQVQDQPKAQARAPIRRNEQHPHRADSDAARAEAPEQTAEGPSTAAASTDTASTDARTDGTSTRDPAEAIDPGTAPAGLLPAVLAPLGTPVPGSFTNLASAPTGTSDPDAMPLDGTARSAPATAPEAGVRWHGVGLVGLRPAAVAAAAAAAARAMATTQAGQAGADDKTLPTGSADPSLDPKGPAGLSASADASPMAAWLNPLTSAATGQGTSAPGDAATAGAASGAAAAAAASAGIAAASARQAAAASALPGATAASPGDAARATDTDGPAPGQRGITSLASRASSERSSGRSAAPDADSIAALAASAPGQAQDAGSEAIASARGGPADTAAATQPAPGAGAPSFAAALAHSMGDVGRTGAMTTVAEARVAAHVASAEFAPALSMTLSSLARNGIQEARLQLHPAEMGPISVQISLDGTGARIDFQADQAPTRQAIEASLPALAGALREAGLTLTGGGVFQQPHDRPAQQGRPGDGGRGTASSSGADPAQGAEPVRTVVARRGLVDLQA